jgi:hypothetical protein
LKWPPNCNSPASEADDDLGNTLVISILSFGLLIVFVIAAVVIYYYNDRIKKVRHGIPNYLG